MLIPSAEFNKILVKNHISRRGKALPFTVDKLASTLDEITICFITFGDKEMYNKLFNFAMKFNFKVDANIENWWPSITISKRKTPMAFAAVSKGLGN